MKKIIVAGVMAFCLIALTQQEASAWVNSKFGMGMNWECQKGGNSFLWGMARNGQPPGPEVYGGHGVSPYGAPQFGAGVQFGGSQGYPQPGFVQPGFQSQAPPVIVPGAAGTFQAPYLNPLTIGSMNQNSAYQFANYPRQVQYYYNPNVWYGNR